MIISVLVNKEKKKKGGEETHWSQPLQTKYLLKILKCFFEFPHGKISRSSPVIALLRADNH